MLSDCNWVNQAQLKQPYSLFTVIYTSYHFTLWSLAVVDCMYVFYVTLCLLIFLFPIE